MKINFCPNCFADTTQGICPQCGFNISELSYSYIELKPGTVVANRYKIGRVLGIGGFGITYIGYDLQQNKRYAVKEYMPKDVAMRDQSGKVVPTGGQSKEVYSKGLDMFLYETNILITLSGNRGIVEAENFVMDNNTGYLVMEYLDGVSVKKLLTSRKTLDYEFALNILIDISQALRAVHAKGLLHRDISPENIMILKDGTVKLIDFGASRFFVGERSKSLSLILKHGFAPPEQYSSSGNQGEWTDIYALAATYYKMITGITIPDALTRVSDDTVERLDKLNPEVKPHIGKAIKKALSVKPKDRYKNIDEFVTSLRFNDCISVIYEDSDSNSVELTQPPKRVGFWKRLFSSAGNTERKKAPGYKTENLEASPVDEAPVMVKEEPKPYVRIVNGSFTLGKWFLPYGGEVFIGRDSSMCSIQILDSSVSRKHCSVEYNPYGNNFIIKDFSANGVFFSNGMRLEKSLSYSLNAGDFVMISSQDYILEVGIQ